MIAEEPNARQHENKIPAVVQFPTSKRQRSPRSSCPKPQNLGGSSDDKGEEKPKNEEQLIRRKFVQRRMSELREEALKEEEEIIPLHELASALLSSRTDESEASKTGKAFESSDKN